MKKRITVLGVLIIFLMTIPAYSQFVLGDAFDSFNTDFWGDYSYNQGYATVENGYLNLSTTEGVRFGRGTVSSNFSLSGDFITNVDFNLVQFDDYFSSATFGIWARDNSFALLLTRKFDFNSLNYYEEVHYMIDGGWQTGFSILTDDLSGKLRLSRFGSTLSSYYYSGGDWQLANSFDLPTGYNSAVRVYMEVGNDGDAGNAPGIEVHYDNFFADATNITGVDGGYLVAQPEPGTIILLGTGLLGLGAVNYLRRRK